jgi:hypothetical protein
MTSAGQTDLNKVTTVRAIVEMHRLYHVLGFLGHGGTNPGYALPRVNEVTKLVSMKTTGKASLVTVDFNIKDITSITSDDGRCFLFQLLRELSPVNAQHESLSLRTHVSRDRLCNFLTWLNDEPEPPRFSFRRWLERIPTIYITKRSWVWMGTVSEAEGGLVELTFNLNTHPLEDWDGGFYHLVYQLWGEY